LRARKLASFIFWCTESGAPLGSPLSGHSDSVRSVCFSPDGSKLVSCSNGSKLVSCPCAALSLSAVGSKLVSCPCDGSKLVSCPCASTSRMRARKLASLPELQRPPGQRSLKRHRACELRPLDGRRAGLLRVLLGTEFDTSRQTNGAGRRYILPSNVAEYWRRARIFESYRLFFYRCRILLFSHIQNV
jgi:hypothetical protein